MQSYANLIQDAASGAVLVEVGTTNRTHPRDYLEAIGPATALVLRVHTSNFRVVGFTETVELADLVAVFAEQTVKPRRAGP